MSRTGLRCAVCDVDIRAQAASSGRGALYCSSACRQRAYRLRLRVAKTDKAAGAAGAESQEDRAQEDRTSRPAAEPPLSVDSFVGRSHELAVIGKLLRSSRLITLFGTVGVGKTRTALELADQVRRTFSGGVRLVELGSLTRPELVTQAVASATGVSEEPGTPLIDTLVASLRDEKVLLIIDNCEHVVDACAELVASLLRRCPGPRILVTSREVLRLPGEMIFPIGELPMDDAMRLFASRAGAVASAFVVSEQNRHLIELICKRLDCLPLAIELAARMVRLLPLQDIADRLEHRFDLLTFGARGINARHGNLMTAIEWSYQLLSSEERSMFRRLSMLPGGFDIELASVVGADSDSPAPAAIQLISSLESKSLIAPTAESQGQARFRQLESVRAYAHQQLVESAEWESTGERLVAWLTRLATPLLDSFLTAGGPCDRLNVEYDNLLRAVDYLTRGTGECDLLLFAALAWCEDARGTSSHGRERLASALRIDYGPPEHRSIVREQMAWLAIHRGDHDEALKLAEQAVELARTHGSTAVFCRSLTVFAYAAQLRKDFTVAIESFAECLRHVRDLRQSDGIALCLNNLAWAKVLAGDLEQAAVLVEEARPMCRNEDSALLHTGAVVALELGDVGDAETKFLDSLRRRDSHNAAVAPFSLEGLGMAAILDGRVERGLRLVTAAQTSLLKSNHTEDPWWRAHVTRIVTRARRTLPGKRVQTLLTEGRGLSYQQALSYALHDTWTGGGTPACPRPPLTKRENDVSELVTQGLTNREIGECLGVSERTVETHIEHVRTKLDLRSRAQIAAWVTRNPSITRLYSA